MLSQPKRFALLAFLAARPRVFHQRDTLLALFWPELDQERARHALNKAVHFLRQELSDPLGEVLVSRGTSDIGINAAALWCDAAAFHEHVEAGRFAEALDLYHDDLLNGFFIEGAPGFDDWLSRERHLLRAKAANAARALARLREQQRSFTTAVAAARRAVDLAEVDERVLRELLELLDRLGDRAGALQAYEVFAERLAAEFGAEPAAETKLAVDRIRARAARSAHAATSSPVDVVQKAAAPTVREPTPIPAADEPHALADIDGWRIERELGRGGMATVYLARDVKHERLVALKMLHPEVALSAGTEGFLHEIQLTARLAHPHILPLIDSGVVAGAPYLVTPYLQGESLRERLRREGQLPVDDALRITREVAAALDYAHRHSVVHCDVKPENILLEDGQALVADFGIALVLSQANGDHGSGTDVSPGTPAYMSPEQVAGERDLDPRSDVYSLGAVLYEMLAGVPPHVARDRRQLADLILTQPIRSVRVLRDSVPPFVDAAVHKALARIPGDRFASAAAFAHALEAGVGSVSVTSTDVAGVPLRRTRWWLAAGITAAIPLLGWRAALRVWNDRPSVSNAASAAVRRATLVLPDSAPLAVIGRQDEGSYRVLAIAPDASTIAYVAAVGNKTMLYTHRLDDVAFHAVPGTEGAHTPFFSPDARWIAYLVGTRLFKAPVQGGRPVLLAELAAPHGGAWLPDGRIVVANGGLLALVPEQGGTAVQLPRRGNGSMVGGTGFTSFPGKPWVTAEFLRQISFLPLRDTVGRLALVDRGALVPGDDPPLPNGLVYGLGPYVVAGAYLVYAQSGADGVVMAAPFDTARMRATGAALPVLDDVRIDDNVPQYDIASDGTLVYVSGRNETLSHLILLDRTGRVDTIPAPRSDVGWLNISRDGRRAVYARWGPGTDSRYVVTDLASGSTTELPDSIERAIWAPDSRSLLATRRVAGGRYRVTLRMSPVTGQVLDTILRNGSVFTVDTAETVFGVKSRNGRPTSIVWKDSTRHPAVEIPERIGGIKFPGGSTLGSISPSGKWIALTAVSNGSWDVFVAPTAHPDSLVRVTRDGGLEPLWNADESEIVYRNHRAWYAVSVSTKGVLHAGTPRRLFDGPYRDVAGYSHAMTPDGHRHLLLLGSSEQTARRIEMILGWPTALRRATSKAP